MTTKRMSDEQLRGFRNRLNDGLYEGEARHAVFWLIAEIDALRAELTAARTVGLALLSPLDDVVHHLGIEESFTDPVEAIKQIERERDEARAALAKARDAALEEAVKIVAGFAVPTPIPTEGVLNFIIQRDFRIAEEIRALKTTPTQESETP